MKLELIDILLTNSDVMGNKEFDGKWVAKLLASREIEERISPP